MTYTKYKGYVIGGKDRAFKVYYLGSCLNIKYKQPDFESRMKARSWIDRRIEEARESGWKVRKGLKDEPGS